MTDHGRIGLILLVALLIVPSHRCAGGTSLPDDEIPEISRIPMYGQPERKRPEVHAESDSSLAEHASLDYEGDRRAASCAFWQLGEQEVRQGHWNTAMSRYNHAWILDQTNYRAYWGFGRVLLHWDRTAEAIKHLETAWRLSRETTPNVAVEAELAWAYSILAAHAGSNPKDRAAAFATANRHFEDCVSLDPGFANGWLRWARSLHREGKYADAQEKVAKARALGTTLPASFLATLSQSAPVRK